MTNPAGAEQADTVTYHDGRTEQIEADRLEHLAGAIVFYRTSSPAKSLFDECIPYWEAKSVKKDAPAEPARTTTTSPARTPGETPVQTGQPPRPKHLSGPGRNHPFHQKPGARGATRPCRTATSSPTTTARPTRSRPTRSTTEGSRIAFYKRKSNANPRFHGELTGSIAAWTVNSLVKAS